MNKRKIYNNVIYWKNRILSLPFGNIENSAPDTALMLKIRKQLLSLPMIYQKIPFEHFKNIPYYRDPTERLNIITKSEKNIKGKRIVDLGSSNGYYCFSLAQAGAKECIGVDGDPKTIKICNMIKKLYNIKNVNFVTSFITPKCIKKVGAVDFTIFFSTFHHIIADENVYSKPYGWKFERGRIFGDKILSAIASCSKRMYFEMGTPYDGIFWRKCLHFMFPDPVNFIENMLSEHFREVRVIKKLDMNVRGQNGRPIFLCKS